MPQALRVAVARRFDLIKISPIEIKPGWLLPENITNIMPKNSRLLCR
jgi:hypothetical protein